MKLHAKRNRLRRLKKKFEESGGDRKERMLARAQFLAAELGVKF